MFEFKYLFVKYCLQQIQIVMHIEKQSRKQKTTRACFDFFFS